MNGSMGFWLGGPKRMGSVTYLALERFDESPESYAYCLHTWEEEERFGIDFFHSINVWTAFC